MRFIKIALFCTQAASHQRPAMKLVLAMLSKAVHLNEKLLTEPGVYRPYYPQQSGGSSSLQETSSSQARKGKQSVNPFVTSTQSDSSQSMTQMLPR
ncbi:unnamed protein product [Ilex paraguariensis]|uniref:Uncharacterized protein n=1 Tax=Ilex paraguariensis TaxID=185542 RepID=A0ABC8T856_9AQUA